MKFQNPRDSPHNLARQGTAPEAPKWQITIRFLKFHFFYIFQKKHAIFKTNKNTSPRGPKTRSFRRGHKSSFTISTRICFFTFLPPKFRHPDLHLRRLATPLHPVPEGLYGVGRPNTLMLIQQIPRRRMRSRKSPLSPRTPGTPRGDS